MLLSPQPGDFVAAELKDQNEVSFRKYRPRGTDSAGELVIELAPLNDDYPTFVIDSKHPGRIFGTMVEHRKYRRRTQSATSLSESSAGKKA